MTFIFHNDRFQSYFNNMTYENGQGCGLLADLPKVWSMREKKSLIIEVKRKFAGLFDFWLLICGTQEVGKHVSDNDLRP